MSVSEQFEKIADYINNNPVATLSTLDDDGTPYGAVVYVCPGEDEQSVYLLTKTKTRKYKNLTARDQVSLTIGNKEDNSTLQAKGHAFITHDAHILDMVTKKMVQANPHNSDWVPPVSRLQAGQYVVVGVMIVQARLIQYKGPSLHSEHLFTEI